MKKRNEKVLPVKKMIEEEAWESEGTVNKKKNKKRYVGRVEEREMADWGSSLESRTIFLTKKDPSWIT